MTCFHGEYYDVFAVGFSRITRHRTSSKKEASFSEDIPLVEFMHLVIVFTRMPGESYLRRLGSLLSVCLCGVFRALINSPAC